MTLGDVKRVRGTRRGGELAFCVHGLKTRERLTENAIRSTPSLNSKHLQLLEELVALLRPRECEVLQRHFGLGPFEPSTFHLVGIQMGGLSRQRVHQLVQDGLRHLQAMIHCYQRRGFVRCDAIENECGDLCGELIELLPDYWVIDD
ncbi:MAG: sigma factor-like helix-turn-helix DNA-binding protein [Planctomycetota bacterium]